MTDKELMRQALGAMALAASSHGVLLLSDPLQDAWKSRDVGGRLRAAIEALRSRLEQPEDEPVAFMSPDGKLSKTQGPLFYYPVYSRPQPASESTHKEFLSDRKPAGWVGLTDEEVDQAHYYMGETWSTTQLVRHIEAKLKEKNT